MDQREDIQQGRTQGGQTQAEPVQTEPVQAEPVAGTPPQGAPAQDTPRQASQRPGPGGRGMARGRGVGQSPTEIAGDLVDALGGTGAKGRVLTEAVIAAGVAKDGQALRRTYQQNKQAVDEYLSHIDTGAAIQETGTGGAIETGGIGAGLGFAGGAVAAYIVRQLFS